MTNIIRSLVVTVVVAWAGSAAAQGNPAGATGSGNAVVPAVPQQDKGAAQGTHDGVQAQPGATGSAATPDTAPTGTVAPPGTGTGAGVGSGTAVQPPGEVAWYDKLANKEIEEEGTFWMPK